MSSLAVSSWAPRVAPRKANSDLSSSASAFNHGFLQQHWHSWLSGKQLLHGLFYCSFGTLCWTVTSAVWWWPVTPLARLWFWELRRLLSWSKFRCLSVILRLHCLTSVVLCTVWKLLWRAVCCDFFCSLWRALLTVVLRVGSRYSCSFSYSQTTIRSWIILSCRFL